MHANIVVGSVLGATEYVAESLQALLEEHGHTATCHFQPNIDDVDLNELLIICTSTHGAGDLPDNIQAFAHAINQQDLSTTSCLIVGLGDSSYDTFCNAALYFQQLFISKNAKLLYPALQIDVLHHPIPEDEANRWLSSILEDVVTSLSH